MFMEVVTFKLRIKDKTVWPTSRMKKQVSQTKVISSGQEIRMNAGSDERRAPLEGVGEECRRGDEEADKAGRSESWKAF